MIRLISPECVSLNIGRPTCRQTNKKDLKFKAKHTKNNLEIQLRCLKRQHHLKYNDEPQPKLGFQPENKKLREREFSCPKMKDNG